MKKVLSILLILVISIGSVFAFTDDEFYEVYDQLVISNEMLKQQVAEIDSLNNQIDLLIKENNKLVDKLNAANKSLNDCEILLEKAKKELADSNKVINTLSNQNWILNLGLSYDFNKLKFGFTVGKKVFLTTFLFGSIYANNNNLELSIAYGALF